MASNTLAMGRQGTLAGSRAPRCVQVAAGVTRTGGPHQLRIVPWTRRLERALLAEDRSRIARELHDGAIQSLYGIGMVLHALRRERDPNRIGPQISEVTASINLVIEDLRAYVHDLTPPSLATRGLGPELCALAQELHARTGIVAAVRLQDGIDQIGSEMGRDLVQIAREALSNVVQHAYASRVTLSLGCTPQLIKLQIVDDGAGTAGGPGREGHGLANIRRRAIGWGGRSELQTANGHGTALCVTLPRRSPKRQKSVAQ